MKEKSCFFILITSFLCLTSSITAQELSDKVKPLRWGADAEGGAPYIFPEPGNAARNVGFEIDLAAALGQELGRPVVFQQYAFAKLTDGVERGDIDLAMNGIEVTADRSERVLFSKPYYAFRLQLVI